MTQEQEVQALREEVASLKFALAELQKAVNAMDPEGKYEMTSVKEPSKTPGPLTCGRGTSYQTMSSTTPPSTAQRRA